MNTNTNTPNAAEKGRKKAAPKNGANTNKPEALKPENTPKKTEERKEGKTMNANTNKTENAAAVILQPEALKKLYAESRNASTAEGRLQAAEAFRKGREDFNAAALKNAVKDCSFLQAAEAFRPNEPKRPEAALKGVDYTRRAEPVDYIHVDEQGNANKRRLNLKVYAAEAFRKAATPEQAEALNAALLKLEAFQKSMIESNNVSGAKAAAEALTEVVKACGLQALTNTPKGFPFYVDRSFVYAAAARLKARKGVYTSAAAAIAEAAAKAAEAAADKHTAAVERYERVYDNAVRVVFGVIAEAAAAAVYGVWKAEVKTAEAMTAEAAERAAKAEEREVKNAATLTERLKKAEAAAKKAEEKALRLKAEAAAKAAEAAAKAEAKKSEHAA